ncbi:hypothetical protein GGS26DRAFT_84941 [Hypomontagnella submonticulosa]|nr:hypothetical protein GGS26DRAFT_84941 [Hypomontagnella submonticulosa]
MDPRDRARPRPRPRGEARDAIPFWRVVAIVAFAFTAFAWGQRASPGDKPIDEPIAFDPKEYGKKFEIINNTNEFWRIARELLADSDGSESWFDEAKANSAVITAMREAVPLSAKLIPKPEYVLRDDKNRQLPKLDVAIKERESSLATAERAFQEFLTDRKYEIRHFVSDRTFWRQYDLNQANTSEGPRQRDDNYYIPAEKLAERRAKDLAEVLQETGWHDLGQYLATALQQIGLAQAFEVQAIRLLQIKSGRDRIWNVTQHGVVLERLYKRVDNLYHATLDIEQIQSRIYVAINRPTSIVRDHRGSAVYWEQATQELLKGWEGVMLNSQEGLLFHLRQRELQKRILGPYHNSRTSWNKWKQRNCGGTTCYDRSNIWREFVAELGLRRRPVAGSTRDENRLDPTRFGTTVPKIWQSSYEKACCSNDESLINFLKSG